MVAVALDLYPEEPSIQQWGEEAMRANLHERVSEGGRQDNTLFLPFVPGYLDPPPLQDGTPFGPLQGPGREYGSVLSRARAKAARKQQQAAIAF
jgi:hypothetical protein